MRDSATYFVGIVKLQQLSWCVQQSAKVFWKRRQTRPILKEQKQWHLLIKLNCCLRQPSIAAKCKAHLFVCVFPISPICLSTKPSVSCCSQEWNTLRWMFSSFSSHKRPTFACVPPPRSLFLAANRITVKVHIPHQLQKILLGRGDLKCQQI